MLSLLYTARASESVIPRYVTRYLEWTSNCLLAAEAHPEQSIGSPINQICRCAD